MVGPRYVLSTLGILLGGLGLSLSRRPVLERWTQQDRPGKGPGEAESDSEGIVGNEVVAYKADMSQEFTADSGYGNPSHPKSL